MKWKLRNTFKTKHDSYDVYALDSDDVSAEIKHFANFDDYEVWINSTQKAVVKDFETAKRIAQDLVKITPTWEYEADGIAIKGTSIKILPKVIQEPHRIRDTTMHVVYYNDKKQSSYYDKTAAVEFAELLYRNIYKSSCK